MSHRCQPRFSRRVLAVVAVAWVTAGCQPTVREDRTITFGRDGRASFQHGRNGVFVTDPVAGTPRRIFEPQPDDLAISPPAWDSAGKRMAFAVARSAGGTRRETAGDAPADGRQYAAGRVRYACWLYDPAALGEKPAKLFEATCGHAGAVAGGMVVAWHPDGRRLDYVDETEPNAHRLFAFDLDARRAEAVPLPKAQHIALGRNGGPRSAVLGGAGVESGLWVEGPDGGGWWRVPESEPASAAFGRQRPCWSRDRKRVAFVAGDALRVCEIATRQSAAWYRFEGRVPLDVFPAEPVDDLHWHPDGTRVGLIHDTHLGLVGPGGWERDLTAAPAVAFAGWDADGRRLAFVTTDPLPYAAIRSQPAPPALASAMGATLLVPNPLARTAVWVADADGGAARQVVSGVRATFPHWSPAGPRLSVWLTVEPPYRLAADGRLGMRPGDPAAVIDADTGRLDWLPVNGTEHAQIGHVELRLGRVGEAVRRFDEAAAALGPDGKADWMFFRGVALRKAGREADASHAMGRFLPSGPVPPGERNPAAALLLVADPRFRVPRGELFRPPHRFAAEAFPSLDMAAEGIEFFRRELSAAAADPDRLSAAVVLGQLLLLADRRAEFAEHVADVLLPLAERVLPRAGEDASAAVAATLLPLAVREFTSSLPDALMRRVCERAAAWPGGRDDVDFVRRLVLRGTARRLGDAALAERAGEGLGTHPARPRWELSDGGEVALASLQAVRMRLLVAELLLTGRLTDATP